MLAGSLSGPSHSWHASLFWSAHQTVATLAASRAAFGDAGFFQGRHTHMYSVERDACVSRVAVHLCLLLLGVEVAAFATRSQAWQSSRMLKST